MLNGYAIATILQPFYFYSSRIVPWSWILQPMDKSEKNLALRAYVQDVCGPSFDDLIEVMRDYSIPPLYIFLGSCPPMKVAIEKCILLLRSKWAQTPDIEKAEVLDLVWFVPEEGEPFRNMLIYGALTAYSEINYSTITRLNRESKVFLAYPDLYERIEDKDGLLVLNGQDVLTKNGLLVGEQLIPYHRFLRNNFNGQFNHSLISALIKLQQEQDKKVMISIDEDHLGRSCWVPDIVELSYWFGASVTEELIDDTNQDGRTVHINCEADFIDPYSHLFCAWKTQKNERVFEIEEIRIPYKATDMVLLRYLHAIRDPQRKGFVHVDGAVRCYTPEQFAARKDSEFPVEKTALYKKVFRVDDPKAEIGTAQWAEIATQWFSGNPLIHELFSQVIKSDESEMVESYVGA